MSFTKVLNELMQYWVDNGIQINNGISTAEIVALETEFGFVFDLDFCTYLKKINGFKDFDSGEDWFSFWSVTRMKEENLDGVHPENVIWFADYLINLCSFGISKNDKKIYIHYQTIAGIESVADSFHQFLNIYKNNPYDLLR